MRDFGNGLLEPVHARNAPQTKGSGSFRAPAEPRIAHWRAIFAFSRRRPCRQVQVNICARQTKMVDEVRQMIDAWIQKQPAMACWPQMSRSSRQMICATAGTHLARFSGADAAAGRMT